MKKRYKVRKRNTSPLRYIYKFEELKVSQSSKKVFLILLSVLGMVSSIYWYLGMPPTPKLDTAVAIAPDVQLSYQIQSYTSSVMGGERTYGICLPPNYGQNPQQRYPVIFLLHGGNGRPTDWFQKGLALPVIEQLYASGKLPYSIIITPDGNDKRGASPFYDPQYIDGVNGRVITAVGNELVKVIKSRYSTLPTPNSWAIGGLSSGGWGALNIGLHNPQNFSVMFSHSGYFRDRSGARNSPVTYIKRISKAKRQQFRIYLDAGDEDGKFLEQTKEFAQVLQRLKIPYQFNQFPGGHTLIGPDSLWNYWHKHLADSLTYVGTQFQNASPAETLGPPNPWLKNN